MRSGYKTTVFYICGTAALGGLLFGLDQGFIANSLDTIRKVYGLDIRSAEHYSSILATGGVIGALLSGLLARYLGRKRSLVLSGFIFCASSLVSALLPPLAVMYVCRFLLGFAIGIASFIVPLYLSETAPASIRGAMGTLFQLLITIGIFLISLTNFIIAQWISSPETALPLMFSVIVVFAGLMFAGSLFLPESPRWLMLKGRKDEATAVLQKTLNTPEDVLREIHDMEATLGRRGFRIGNLLKGYFIKILLVGIFLQVFQQLVGINVMIYYAPTIFGYAGLAGMIAMMTVPTVNMLFTFPAIRLVEKWGRKKLLYVGALCMMISMTAAGGAFTYIGNPSDPAAIGLAPKGILLAAVIFYIFGFAVSWGPVAWLVCSEIFPIRGREVGMTVTTMVNWTFAGLLMDNALTFMEAHGHASIFFLFAFFCILAIAFVAAFVPETRGVTLEQIEGNLKAGKKMRDLGD
ncbi:MAG: sugar porter family MFS transporter [Syntrophaceae bacterium]|nr:sugar porter family MFS transporter [Syntrophaceae bacterium]MBP8666267.1 sugar porter family MFS transporter [Syntrophaceae bacterium]MBP9532699.1 sugar porter family MFS transporter [Syntrophaceae bacterium]MBP9650177.1 sugar porter family MFS transporter [Syntrophaceae bacterium]